MCRAWDLAASKKGDWTVGLLLAGPDERKRLYVLDIVRARLDVHERDELILRTAERDGRAVKIRIPQDPGAAGKSQAKYTVTQLAGFDVKYVRVTGDKVTRAGPVAAQFNVGNIAIVKGNWGVKDFLGELQKFPNGKHDDQVDAFSDAYDELGGKPPLIVV
jgi:predicted phage terminase large subunit-like protein